MKWTSQQQQAIDGRDGTMLVSAAAGSGKTAVLVERVMQRLCRKENPCKIENLLIVTFTKAAAAQMKEKISAKLSEKIVENPDNKALRLSKMMLPYANICTIDSFCINLVRDNFHSLDISPDFSILDENSEIAVMSNKAMLQVINDFHRSRGDEFTFLNNLLNKGRDDNGVVDAITDLYRLAMANIFPEYWLDSLCDVFNDPLPPEESFWGKMIIKELKNIVNNAYENCLFCLKKAEEDPQVIHCYGNSLNNDKLRLEELKALIETGGWDEIFEKGINLSFGVIGKISGEYDPVIKETVANTRKNYSEKKALVKSFSDLYVSEADYFEDMAVLAPAVRTLIDAVKEYKHTLDEMKKEANGYGFDDILHFTIDLLVENHDGQPVRTALAKELSENYEEILVDEYQDVNRAQDAVFYALSKDDTNRFMVGDVKQSIYGFRQAMPEIFTDLREEMTPFDGKTYPACVTLGNNFRSRKGVIDTVNFVFNHLMTKESGDIDYDENEKLNFSASYDETDSVEAELCLIEAEKENSLKYQANYITQYITDSINNGMTVTDGDSQRPAQYRDFCILLRKTSGGNAKVFTDALEKAGIPVVAESDSSFLVTPEIVFLISLLKVIDNPVDDIPLSSVLLSPAFGFTPDDLSEMRIEDRTGSFYACLVFAAENGNEKAKNFIKKTEEMRRISVTLSAGEFISRVIDEIGYRALVSAMKDGEERLNNINSFVGIAAKYEVNGVKGVSGFIRFLDKLTKKEDLKSDRKKTDAANAVKIMTIHKSKGLEFPVVFLANCEKKNYDEYNQKNFLLGKKSGIGLKCIVNDAVYETLPYKAAKLEARNASHSEELRILYVALTRAREKLIMLAGNEDWAGAIGKIDFPDSGKPDPYAVIKLKGFWEYLLYALIRHPDAHALRQAADLPAGFHDKCDSRLITKIITSVPEVIPVDEGDGEFEVSDEIRQALRDRLDYAYPYDELKTVVAKRIASDLDGDGFNEEYFASDRPAFAGEGKLTPAQRGIATHRFMQFSDYNRVKSDFESELRRLVDTDMLTEAEAAAVDPAAIKKFFESPLSDRILKAEKVYKEYAFTVALPVKELYPEISDKNAEGEVIIVEGVVDCAFTEDGKLVIVDYKTDKAFSDDELVGKYSAQLNIYRKCLGMVLDIPVKEAVIYSFRLGREIKV